MKSVKNIRFLVFVLVYLVNLLDNNVFAFSDKELSDQIRKEDYQSIVNSLKFYNIKELSNFQVLILYKSFLFINNEEESGKIFEMVIVIGDNSLITAIINEKINFLIISNKKSYFLNFIRSQQNNLKSIFFARKIKNIIIKEFNDFYDKGLLKDTIKSLFVQFPDYYNDPDLLAFYLKLLEDESSQSQEILVAFWQHSDILKLPKKYRKKINSLLKKKQVSKDLLKKHFLKQFKYRNYSYLINTLPDYFSFFQDDFLEIRDVYFKSLIRKRYYSKLIHAISTKKGIRRYQLSVEESLLLRFKIWLKRNRIDKALQIVERFKGKKSQAEIRQLYIKIAKYYFNQRKYQKTINVLNEIGNNQLSNEEQGAINWILFRSYQLTGNFQGLKGVLDWSAGFDFNDSKMGAKFCYWQVKLDGYSDNALMGCFLKYPLTYYGLRSYNLIKDRGRVTTSFLRLYGKIAEQTEKEKSILEFATALGHLREIELLKFLLINNSKPSSSEQYLFNMIKILYENNLYNLILRVLNDNDRLLLDEKIRGLFLTYNYPVAFKELIEIESDKHKLSPHLVYAVIREESKFDKDAESPVGALGLMQLMPKTAKYLGKKNGLRVKKNQIKEIKINIFLGTYYLKKLLKRFKGNQFYALAAYNGGASNVKKWRKRLKHEGDDDFFVESISFRETKNYVKKVLRSFYIYQALYESQS